MQVDNSSLNTAIKSADMSRGKIHDKDDCIRQLEMEVKHIEQSSRAVEGQNQKLQDLKIEAERRAEGLRRQIDMLTQDKNFLTRESSQLQESVKRLEDKLERSELSLLEAKKQAEKYMDRALSANDDVKNKFDS